VVTAAVGDTIRSKIGKPKRKRRSSDSQEKDCRAVNQRIDGRTLGRAAWPPTEIMEIDLPGGGAVRKCGQRRLGFGRFRGREIGGIWWLYY
jgi:hypothetical protein